MKRLVRALPIVVTLVACGANPGSVGPLAPDAEGGAGGYPGGVAGGAGASGMAGSSGAAGDGGGTGGGAAGQGAGGGGGAAGGGGASGAAGVGGAGPSACTAADASVLADVEVAQVDALGWAPYAVDGCSLLYVAVAANGDTSKSGALRLRSLVDGTDVVVADESETPRRPTLRGDILAWEATLAGKSVVRIKVGAKPVITMKGVFQHAGEPRAGEAGVAFTAWMTTDELGDTDVYLYDRATGATVPIATGPAQQRWADVSATHVAYSDFVEDPDGTFGNDSKDVCDIGLVELATMKKTTYAKPGKQAYPMLGSSGYAVFLEWPADHPEPKNVFYSLRSWGFAGATQPDVELSQVIHNDSFYARPATRDGVVTWVASAPQDTLFRVAVEGGSPAVIPMASTVLRSPAMTSSFVAIAGIDAANAAKLRVAPLQ